ncbi:transglycosylase SLT domain-containing protein [Alicyclobacillus acidocaldarius]|uniref:Lytic transglycosylase catalytic n=1 Tax=Alicyclobacillus acidocaldarius (strain Tc-4-1) TaxID=1048834 RepID=F8ILA5_ALIAT|nr:transglycosylase SLT domain-containing protein [Alicyclobacillus acidocaldarius]AEJ43671.1 Lytic transglycosylase catalytic [Alicyclobacillus acidocaldarius subsp. acidocaldarius Tc-4-1]
MTAILGKIGLRIGLRLARRHWPLLVLLALLLVSIPGLLVVLLVVAIFAGGDALNTAVPSTWNGQIPTDVSPADGIPAPFVDDVQQASETYQVPMQYIAATALHESSWEPNAYADYDGSHAMGLMQFEPETWSGWSDPYVQIDEPDTDALRIAQYGGYGVDADGIWAPIGTPAEAALQPQQLEVMNEQCQANGNQGCAPYASPYDPDDALNAGAKYLHTLYLMAGSWPGASAKYYGTSDYAAIENYINALVRMTAAYVMDTPPVQLPGQNGYWLFGDANLTFTPSPGGWEVKADNNDHNSPLAAEWLPSLPIISPASGVVSWTDNPQTHIATISLPLSSGATVEIQAPENQVMKWDLGEQQVSANVAAGDLVGFIDVLKPIQISSAIAELDPGLSAGVVTPPGQPVHGGA